MPTGPKKVPIKSKSFARPNKRGDYGSTTHQTLRRLLLERFPMCQYAYPGICTGWSTQADHLRYPATCLDDYRACCSACHRKRHQTG